MCLFFQDVYDRNKFLLIFRQKLHPFSDFHFCMDDIMTEMDKEDLVITYFGSTWSCATNAIADTSTESTCQSK